MKSFKYIGFHNYNSDPPVRSKVLQMHFAVCTSNISSIINQYMSVTQVCIITPFFLESSKWQPNAWLPSINGSKSKSLVNWNQKLALTLLINLKKELCNKNLDICNNNKIEI